MNLSVKTTIVLLLVFFTFLILSCGINDPLEEGVDQYVVSDLDTRGVVFITEVHWAGSVNSQGIPDPDDDFIEIFNIHETPIDLSGWSFTLSHGQPHTITIPPGVEIQVEGFITIGSKTSGAFPEHDVIVNGLALPNEPFSIRFTAGVGQTADTIDFTSYIRIPGGSDLPRVKRSMIRDLDFFGSSPGHLASSWATYPINQVLNISPAYENVVFASPGGVSDLILEPGCPPFTDLERISVEQNAIFDDCDHYEFDN